jgi:hypothetical protein
LKSEAESRPSYFFWRKSSKKTYHRTRNLPCSAFTGFLYPLIPETFDEVKNTMVSTANDIQKNVPIGLSGSIMQAGDPGIKIGPANF